jgi:hypothetical protein
VTIAGKAPLGDVLALGLDQQVADEVTGPGLIAVTLQ